MGPRFGGSGMFDDMGYEGYGGYGGGYGGYDEYEE